MCYCVVEGKGVIVLKVGDLIEFNATGDLATIIESGSGHGYRNFRLMVHGDVLKDTPCSDGLTWMSFAELKRLAEVVG